jgi:nicotinate-nucleotide adenylyltransferase
MARPGFHLNFDALPPAFGSLRSNAIDVPQVDVSATDIRRRAKMGLSIDQLVPAAVADYITRLGLYRAEAP